MKHMQEAQNTTNWGEKKTFNVIVNIKFSYQWERRIHQKGSSWKPCLASGCTNVSTFNSILFKSIASEKTQIISQTVELSQYKFQLGINYEIAQNLHFQIDIHINQRPKFNTNKFKGAAEVSKWFLKITRFKPEIDF